MFIMGRPAWIIPAQVIGIPTSPAMTSAISPLRAASPSWRRRRYFWRSSTSVWLQAGKAALAAATALSTSAAVPLGMRPMTSSVAALITSIVPEPSEATHAPSM